MTRHDDGFTLIELLTVVVIIGVLAAIAIPQFLDQRQRAYQASVSSVVRNAVPIVEGHVARTGSYPADGADLTTLGLKVDSLVRVTYAAVGAGYRINADHMALDGDGDGDPSDGDVDAFYDSATGRVVTP